MHKRYIETVEITHGVYHVNIKDANVRVLCGTPCDVVKLLMKKELILPNMKDGFFCESGPNTVLLSDITIQNFSFSNLCEFPILQMLYRQGMGIPNHPNNTGIKPTIMGLKEQVDSQIEYIFRGNYGLFSQEEIEDAGIESNEAKAMMNMKLKFAFGSIKSSAALINSIYLDDNILTPINNEVYIKRDDLNIYTISYKGEEVMIDLNLKRHENYAIPYELDFFNIKKSYFSVIHSGQGDGWSLNHPSMSSVVMFHGKVYLIDAGPNIQNILLRLGIGLNDIEGIFHTHGHDDHFVGLTDLLKIDHKIKYYSTKLVRVSVMKKLSALLNISAERLNNCFEYIDLEFDEWTNIDGLEVKPVFSAHPIETNIFFFRTFWINGYKTYAHLADITSFKVLDSMVVEDENIPGITKEFNEKKKSDYLERVTLKKVDVGGGMIHGELDDFKKDDSKKIIIAHRATQEYTNEELEIASKADFGEVDELIPTKKNYLRHSIAYHMKELFPNIIKHKFQVLMNCEIKNFAPNTVVVGQHEKNDEVYLLLSGAIETSSSHIAEKKTIFSGTLIGDISAMTDNESHETYKTLSYVNALAIPKDIYTHYIGFDYLSEILMQRMSLGLIFEEFEIFSDFLSIKTQNKIAESIIKRAVPKGTRCDISNAGLYLLVRGSIECKADNQMIETISSGNSFAQDSIFKVESHCEYMALEDCEVYVIPRETIEVIPIIYLKIYSIYQKIKKNV